LHSFREEITEDGRRTGEEGPPDPPQSSCIYEQIFSSQPTEPEEDGKPNLWSFPNFINKPVASILGLLL
jgi:hypothetical protein